MSSLLDPRLCVCVCQWKNDGLDGDSAEQRQLRSAVVVCVWSTTRQAGTMRGPRSAAVGGRPPHWTAGLYHTV